MTQRVADGPQLAVLLETLDRHGVAYVVAGSVAAMAHGAPGVEPGDLDVVPATDAANLERLRTVLDELDANANPETGAWEGRCLRRAPLGRGRRRAPRPAAGPAPRHDV